MFQLSPETKPIQESTQPDSESINNIKEEINEETQTVSPTHSPRKQQQTQTNTLIIPPLKPQLEKLTLTSPIHNPKTSKTPGNQSPFYLNKSHSNLRPS